MRGRTLSDSIVLSYLGYAGCSAHGCVAPGWLANVGECAFCALLGEEAKFSVKMARSGFSLCIPRLAANHYLACDRRT